MLFLGYSLPLGGVRFEATCNCIFGSNFEQLWMLGFIKYIKSKMESRRLKKQSHIRREIGELTPKPDSDLKKLNSRDLAQRTEGIWGRIMLYGDRVGKSGERQEVSSFTYDDRNDHLTLELSNGCRIEVIGAKNIFESEDAFVITNCDSLYWVDGERKEVPYSNLKPALGVMKGVV